MSLYKNFFEKVMNSLEEELNGTFSEVFWLDITSRYDIMTFRNWCYFMLLRLYATFWLLSVNDLSAPISAYKREIEKCRKELTDASESVISF